MIDLLVFIAIFLCTLFVAVLLQWLILLASRPSTLPPGPLPLPIIGNIWVFFRRDNDVAVVLEKLHAKYGGAVSIYCGCSSRGLVVILFDWKTITQLANAEIVSNRPFSISECRGVKTGILWAQFEVARHRRRLFMRAFKDFGLASNNIPSHVDDELEVLLATIKRNIGQPFEPGNCITDAVASCILMSVYSQRFDPNDANISKIIAGGRAFFEGNFLQILLLPYLGLFKYFFRDESANGERQMEMGMSKWLQSEMEQRKTKFNHDQIADVLDAYMATNQKDALAFDGFMRSCVDIFLGAMETTSTLLAWALFFLAHMPDEQDRLFQEIEMVVGGSTFPTIEHRRQLVRLDAFILETLRYSSMVPFSITRRFSDVARFGQNIEQFQVDANTSIIFSLCTLNFDAEYWLDPKNFRLERWLDPNKPGHLVTHSHSLPFGIGKRACPGEAVARNLMFIFLAAFIQRFKWRLVNFVAFNACRSKLARMPPEHQLIFTERQ